MRIVLNAPKVLLSSALMLAGLLALPSVTAAAGLTIQGGMTAEDFFKLNSGSIRTVDFGRGSSQFYDNGDLHVVTDDLMYLQAAAVSVSNKLDVTGDLVANYPIYAKGNQINFGGGSNIQDNASGTLSTYSKGIYYVTAPTVSLSNDLDVTKNATIQGNLTANGTFAVRNNANDVTTFSVASNTGNTDIAGTLNVKDAAVFNGWLDATSGLTVDSGGMDVNLDGGVVFRRSDDDAYGGAVAISKDRAKGAVQSGDELGYLSFNGADSTGASSMGAYIMSKTSGTIGASRVPADFEFYTQPDAANSQAQRMVISSAGNVTMNLADSGTTLTVAGGGVQFNTNLTFGSGATGPSARTIKIGDYSAQTNDAPVLTIQGSNQTKSDGGNGGNVVINAGSSTHSTAGTITIGTVGSAVTITPPTTVTGLATFNGGAKVTGKLNLTPATTTTIATDGAGTKPNTTLTVTKALHQIACGDPDGCDIGLAAGTAGDVVTILNVSASNVAYIKSNAETKLDGGADVALDPYGSIQLVYYGTTWIQIGKISVNHGA